MQNNYILGIGNLLSFRKINHKQEHAGCNTAKTLDRNNARHTLTVVLLFCIAFSGYGQKNGNKKITLTTCIQQMDNGMLKAYLGYSNPTNQVVTVDQKDSFIYLNDHNKDDENDNNDAVNHQNGVEKLPGLTTFLPGTHNKAFFVVFNGSGHAKWTVLFEKNKKTKIRANSKSSICPDDSVIFPVFGGAGKSFTRIGSELTALATGNAGGNNGEAPSDIIYQINEEGEVLIEIVPKNNRMQFVLGLLQNTFGRQYNSDPTITDFIVDPLIILSKNLATIDVFFPINQLLLLNDYPDDLNFSRPLYRPFRQVGTVDSQGDGTMLTNIVREAFVLRDESGTPMQVDGSGIKVGVISDSYDKANLGESQATADVGSKDLPGIAGIGNPDYPIPVEVLKDYPYGKASDEGRAMLQIVHDVAPGAALGFRTGVLSPRDMALAIDDFALRGYEVCADDVTYPLAPFYEDGEIAQAIKDFVDLGGTYTTSSGNFAKNAQQGNFTNSNNTQPLPSFLGANTRAHVFGNPGSNPVMQEISVAPGTYFIVLQWDEDLASQNNSSGAGTDLDMYLVNAAGVPLVDTNRVNLFGDSVEAMVFQAVANSPAYIMITSANGPAPEGLPFRYIAFRSNGLNIIGNPGAPTVSGHAMTDVAITVGAVNYTTSANPVPETFSSFAGPLTNGTTLYVDISAPDGVEVNVPGFGPDPDGDGFSSFFGTSAAAPHVAGAAALLLSTALPPEVSSTSWYPDGLPVGVLELFQTNAAPITGSADQAGSGLLDALASFNQIAAQTAVLTDLTLVTPPEEGVLSIDDVVVRLTGKYLPVPTGSGESGEPIVPLVKLVGGEVPIPLAVNSFSDTEIMVTVPAFTGMPNVVVYTDPNTTYSPLGAGGGDSNPLPIFDDGQIALKITAVDVDIEYGQSYEDKFDFTVEGLSREAFDLLGLPEITYISSATPPYPGANNYAIIPSFNTETATVEQLAALEGFIFNFEDGLLRVTKKDLTITPDAEEITYGDAITLALNYDYDETGIASPDDFPYSPDLLPFPDFATKISEAHMADFYVDNTLALINRFNAVVNTEIFGELQGGSWMATEETLLNLNNRFNAVVNGMDLINMDVQDLENYLVNRFNAVVNTELNRFNAVVNGEGLLNGTVFFNNRFNAVVNGSSLGQDENDFAKVFAILDLGDDSADEPSDSGIAKFYAMNMITGLSATGTGEGQILQHYSYPGAFIAPIAANFNITYVSNTINVNKAQLSVQTPNLSIDYGTGINSAVIDALLNLCDCPGIVVEGYVFEEDKDTVFPDGFPYYFENEITNEKYFLDGEVDLILPPGRYFIKISDPNNYMINFNEDIGILTVEQKEFSVIGDYDGDYPVDYGDAISPYDLDDYVFFVGLDEEELDALFPYGNDNERRAIPYILEDVENSNNTFELDDQISVGRYYVKINMEAVEGLENYVIDYEETLIVRVDKKQLIFNADAFEKEYGEEITGDDIRKFDNPSESNVPVLQGFVFGDNEEEIFDGAIPYVFESEDGETEIPLGQRLVVGEYYIRIDSGVVAELQNYTVFYEDDGEEQENNVLEINKAELFACIADVDLRNGELLTPDMINATILGFFYDDNEGNVFPNGIVYAVIQQTDGGPVETIIPEEGLVLGEGTYAITILDEFVQNYRVVDGEACKDTGTLTVTQCGNALVLDFNNYVPDGTRYRYANVAPTSGLNLDALVTIQTNGTVNSFTLDQNNFSSGSADRKQFRPSASFTITTAVPEPYVEFSITLVNAGTNTPANEVGKLIAGVLDVDGENAYQEYVEINLPSEYTVDGATQLGVIQDPSQGLLRINGYNNSYTGNFNGEPRVNVEVVYEDVSSFVYRIGAKRNGSGTLNVPTRQFGMQFTCLTNFNTRVTEYPNLGIAGLMAASVPENECVVYNNPVGPTNNNILYLQPKEGVSGAANVTLTSMDNPSFSNAFLFESEELIEINMDSWANGMYIVQISIGNCQSDGFIVIKE